jgi:serine/threonine-protein kinase
VRLPGLLSPDDRYVPAGPCAVGTADRVQRDGMRPREVWLDSFVIRRFPVTNGEYLAFLDALVAAGRADEARERAPTGAMELRDGRFRLVPDAEGHLWEPDWPVFQVDWTDACAYAAYEAERTGLPWRLPGELEWEKAARGVDARRYPWGDWFEDTWCNMRSSAPVPAPGSVRAFPIDRSPYGVRGLAGNVGDWCLDPFVAAGPPLDDDARWSPDRLAASTGFRVARGGTWTFNAISCATSYRMTVSERERPSFVGIRLARSVP